MELQLHDFNVTKVKLRTTLLILYLINIFPESLS